MESTSPPATAEPPLPDLIPEPAPPSDGMAKRVLSGVGWKVASQVTLQLTRAGVAIVLARLLTPEDFGLVGLSLVFAALFLVFGDLGMGSALVHRETLRPGDRSTVFWSCLYVGVLLALTGIATSGFVADFFDEPEVQPLFAALSASFVFTSLASTHNALLTRSMNFRALETAQMIAGVLGGAVGVGCAVVGLGPWAIVNMTISTAFANMVLLWVWCPWRPRFRYSVDALRRMSGYSLNVFGYGFMHYFERNVDNLLVGRFLGATPLGIYSLSYNLMLYPLTKIADPVRQVLFPAMSRIQDQPARITALWLRVTRLLGALTMPAMAGLIVAAPEFVEVVLGNRWDEAIPVIRVLAWVGVLLVLESVFASVLLSRGRADWLFRWGLVSLVGVFTSFVAGLHWGVVGVATAFAIASTILMPAYTFVVARSVDMPVSAFFRALSGVARATLAMTAAIFALRLGLIELGLPPSVRLVAVIVAGAALYVPLVLWQAPEVRAEAARGRAALRSGRAARAARRAASSSPSPAPASGSEQA